MSLATQREVKEVFILADRLRDAAARSLARARVVAAIGQVCARWSEREFGPRRETVAAITAAWGWSEALIDESIDALITPFNAEALERLARRMAPDGETPKYAGARPTFARGR